MRYCSSANNDTIFDKALKMTLIFEGGYVNHPNDPGGETNKGITKAVYDAYRINKNLPIQSVKDITDNEIKEIYFENYWMKASCDKIPGKLAILHFDTSVNCGIKQASRFLQKSIGCITDGFIGPKTIETLKNIKDTNGLTDIINKYMQERLKFYNTIAEKNLKLKVFLEGWNNRISLLKKYLQAF